MLFDFLNKLYDIFGIRREIRLGIYGDVNVGKSTLANRISKDWGGDEFTTVSTIPHETRMVKKKEKLEVNLPSGKKILLNLLDMPGLASKVDYRSFIKYGIPKKEAKMRAREATTGVIEAIKWLNNVDTVLAVMDASEDPLTQINLTLLGNLQEKRIPVILVANKIDKENADMDAISQAFPDYPLVGVSALTGKNINDLYHTIGKHARKRG